MKIFIAITYYRPHVSGLTIYVERLARALAKRGNQVTVLTSHYDPKSPLQEQIDGVMVKRVPVAFRVSKGVIMPKFGWMATEEVRQHDVVSIHLPQFDAAGIALRARVLGKPCLLTYHSDLLLPKGIVNRVVNTVVDLSNHAAALLSSQLCAYTDDFARHSRLLSHYLPKVKVVNPPVEMAEPSAAEIEAWRKQHNPENRRPVIGIAARLATEKGVEHLLAALPTLLAKYPELLVLHAGPVKEVIGEEAYFNRLKPLFEQYKEHYHFLGTLNPAQMALFFSNCDIHVLPSINNTETFGLVQVEAALCGTPSVASALPGVRMPTRMTKMGLSVPPADPQALAQGICTVLDNPALYHQPRGPIAQLFAPDTTAAAYETIFNDMLHKK